MLGIRLVPACHQGGPQELVFYENSMSTRNPAPAFTTCSTRSSRSLERPD
jgi:hypothetical protein